MKCQAAQLLSALLISIKVSLLGIVTTTFFYHAFLSKAYHRSSLTRLLYYHWASCDNNCFYSAARCNASSHYCLPLCKFAKSSVWLSSSLSCMTCLKICRSKSSLSQSRLGRRLLTVDRNCLILCRTCGMTGLKRSEQPQPLLWHVFWTY